MTFRLRPLLLLLTVLSVQAPPCRGDDAESPQELRVAGVVLKWVRGDRDANFARLVPLVRQAAEHGANVVCTTECFLDGYSIDDKSIPLEQFRSLGEPIPGGLYFTRLEQLADELDIYLIVGILERQGQQLYNAAVILGPDGALLGKHRKQKLEHEAVRITPGVDASPLATPIGSLGLMICADRRKPELVAELCTEGADILFCPSGGMFGPRKNDWILQDRSRENEKYIVFTHPTEFLVTDPAGRIVHRVLLGDDLEMDPEEIGTSQDSRGVFYFDFERNENGKWQASTRSGALSRPSMPTHAAKEEVRAFASRRVPDVRLGDSRDAWLKQADALRKRLLHEVMFRGTAAAWRDAPSQVHWHDEVIEGRGYRIRKFRYEALPGFWLPALLYEPAELRDKMPVVINPNGHHGGGKAMPYKQRRCINLARRGMLAYSLEFIDMGQLRDRDNRHNRLVQLDLCGTSGLAPFYLALTRAIDVALDHPNVDPERVAVAGLSGGGWQSILLAALDTRVTLANPVAGYCGLHARIQGDNNIGDARKQIPSDMCAVADYTHLTAMVAPASVAADPTTLKTSAASFQTRFCLGSNESDARHISCAKPLKTSGFISTMIPGRIISTKTIGKPSTGSFTTTSFRLRARPRSRFRWMIRRSFQKMRWPYPCRGKT